MLIIPLMNNHLTVDRNPEKDLDKIISAINSDPLHAMSAERMNELKDVRTHIVTMLAHKVAAKKKPTGSFATVIYIIIHRIIILLLLIHFH